MPFHTLKPLISKAESIKLRRFIIELQDTNPFSHNSEGSKLSLSSHKDDSTCEAIFQNTIIQNLSRKVLESGYLQSISRLMKAEAIFENRGLGKIESIKPYAHSSILKELGDKGYWRSSLLPLNQDKNRLNSIIKNHLRLGNLIFMPRLQLSIMKPGSFISPHTDVSDKLASLMIYLPMNDNQLKTTLGTKFWYSNNTANELGEQTESKFITDWRENKAFDTARYEQTFFGYGTSVLFFRTNSSWHSVDIPKEEDGNRVSININFVLPTDLQS